MQKVSFGSVGSVFILAPVKLWIDLQIIPFLKHLIDRSSTNRKDVESIRGNSRPDMQFASHLFGCVAAKLTVDFVVGADANRAAPDEDALDWSIAADSNRRHEFVTADVD